MTDTAIDLASLLCSRLCHDLLSPVGALNNGLELLAEEKDPEMRKRCMELLEQSARTSADKLKFFRLAFGAAGGFGDTVPVEEPKALIDALVAGNGRIAVSWTLGVAVLPKPAVKLLSSLDGSTPATAATTPDETSSEMNGLSLAKTISATISAIPIAAAMTICVVAMVVRTPSACGVVPR